MAFVISIFAEVCSAWSCICCPSEYDETFAIIRLASIQCDVYLRVMP